jgi:2'-5' RNA ligase
MFGGRRGPQMIGVLAPVPEPHAAIIQHWRHELGDKTADIVPPHVTLLGPVFVPAKVFDAVVSHIEVVANGTAPISMHLSGTASFRPVTPTAFVEMAGGRPELEALARGLNSGPLQHEPAYDYRPHVTIANEMPAAVLDRAEEVLADFEAEYVTEAIGLYSPDGFGKWQVLRWFALRG